MFISLKPLAERDNVSTQRIVARLRGKLSQIPGIRVFMVPAQDLRVGGRQSDSQYQFTLWSADIDPLQSLGAEGDRPGEAGARRGRRHHRPRARRPAGQCHHRPQGGRAARRAHPGHRQRAQRRVLAAADFDHLHPAQPVSRHSGSGPPIPARPGRPHPGLRAGHRQHAGAAIGGGAGRARRSRRWW